MFSLNFRESLIGLSQSLVDEFDQIVASAQSRWFRQHNAKGEHTILTAASVTTPRLALTDSAGQPWSLYVSPTGTLYIVSGTSATGGTVVGTQT
jgi:hypothetical protein